MPGAESSALNETTRMFGERVRQRRLELGLSQEAAAVRCGIHWTQLGKVERGQRSLRLETIVKIAAGLDSDTGSPCHWTPASLAGDAITVERDRTDSQLWTTSPPHRGAGRGIIGTLSRGSSAKWGRYGCLSP